MYFEIDARFVEYFKNIKQVFLYVVDECNLKCVHCLYKPDLTFHLKEKEIELKTALGLISDLREMGASKLTVMGGEPTLYGLSQNWEPLLILIEKAKLLGYEYVRMDTNGQFNEKLLLKERFKMLDEITFSLDGPKAEVNDPIRGVGVFDRCVKNIKKAVDLNYIVNITCCLHRGLIKRNFQKNLLLDEMILFAQSMGVSQINFHDLFKTGIPRDVWTNTIDITLKEWISVWEEIQKNIEAGNYKIPVRIPQSFVEVEEFYENSQYYGYCPAKIGERVLVHPNGMIRVCSLLIGTPYGIAKYYDGKIVWENSSTNELRDHKLDQNTPCTNQNKNNSSDKIVPLCVSFKPKQKELIWMEKLNWEEKNQNKI